MISVLTHARLEDLAEKYSDRDPSEAGLLMALDIWNDYLTSNLCTPGTEYTVMDILEEYCRNYAKSRKSLGNKLDIRIPGEQTRTENSAKPSLFYMVMEKDPETERWHYVQVNWTELSLDVAAAKAQSLRRQSKRLQIIADKMEAMIAEARAAGFMTVGAYLDSVGQTIDDVIDLT